ncbi:MAG: 50S ribosomal protein L11 methyltransferase [Chloroflexota bacterium]|nr:50S ribosomal protein L11 methyltransferase [Dehalococcoidia bacterium]MDW8253615.1 50S ribosomal protein L11 methyltransferase [Chloroflexota bacterium]
MSYDPLRRAVEAAAARFERWQPQGAPVTLTPSQRAALIRDATAIRRPAFVPELALYLAEEPFTVWQRTEEAGGAELPPPYWAFAWAGGLALARYLLDHPETVSGRTVLDLASGSGLTAIAAARAGARRVVANDIDPFALTAAQLNAEVNGVAVEMDGRDLLGSERVDWEVVLAGDIFYERETAERVQRFLRRAHASGAAVLIGDLGRRYLPRPWLMPLAVYEVPVEAALEDRPVKRTTVWRFREESELPPLSLGYT